MLRPLSSAHLTGRPTDGRKLALPAEAAVNPELLRAKIECQSSARTFLLLALWFMLLTLGLLVLAAIVES
jgi:hypothetical protein